MFKNTLNKEVLNDISNLFFKEINGEGRYTEAVMEKISCSRSFVSKLRKNWSKNDGLIKLKDPTKTTVKEKQDVALNTGLKYFSIGTNCLKCSKDERYSSTGSCVACSKQRNQRNVGILDMSFNVEDNLPALTILDRTSRLESGLICNL